jgi:hypothetical protein
VQIIVAKLNCEPNHSLNRKDIKRIFSLVPDDWKKLINKVVLSAEMFSNSRFSRPVIHSSISLRLNVLSRGLTKEHIVAEVFRELALNSGIAESTYGNRITKPNLSILNKAIEPYVTDFFENEI